MSAQYRTTPGDSRSDWDRFDLPIYLAFMCGITFAWSAFVTWDKLPILRAEGWPATTATVTDGKLVYKVYEGRRTLDRAELQYGYAVDGREYAGSGALPDVRADAEPKIGGPIRVYYDPHAPGNSLLRVGWTTSDQIVAGVAGVTAFGLLLAGVLLLAATKRLRRIRTSTVVRMLLMCLALTVSVGCASGKDGQSEPHPAASEPAPLAEVVPEPELAYASLAPDLVAAWQKAGATLGRIGIDRDGGLGWDADEGPLAPGEIPTFMVRWRDIGLDHLPIPDKSFGLYLHCLPPNALPALARMKTLHALCLNLATADNGIKHLAGLTELRVVDIGGRPGLTMRHGPSRGLTELRMVDAGGPLKDDEFQVLSRLPELRYLATDDAQPTLDGWKAMARLRHLRYLRLACPSLSDEGLAAMSGPRTLEVLHLMAEGATGTGFRAFAAHPRLRRLFLRGIPVTDPALGYLATLPQLEELYLGDQCLVTDAGLAQLSRPPRLRRLEGFTGSKDAVRRLMKARNDSRPLREFCDRAGVYVSNHPTTGRKEIWVDSSPLGAPDEKDWAELAEVRGPYEINALQLHFFAEALRAGRARLPRGPGWLTMDWVSIPRTPAAFDDLLELAVVIRTLRVENYPDRSLDVSLLRNLAWFKRLELYKPLTRPLGLEPNWPEDVKSLAKAKLTNLRAITIPYLDGLDVPFLAHLTGLEEVEIGVIRVNPGNGMEEVQVNFATLAILPNLRSIRVHKLGFGGAVNGLYEEAAVLAEGIDELKKEGRVVEIPARYPASRRK